MDQNWQQFLEKAANELLVWVGFGTITGLTAKAIMPGKDPGGAVATLLTGVTGTIIGCGTLAFFYPDKRVTPVSLSGFACATGGAFLLLLFYRILGGKLFKGMQGNQDVILLTTKSRRSSPKTILREVA
ncbi:MAG TPA: GlsB/YeaQ/YmgE family stress response membrane protein [Caulifigura sp.]|nr:GlsB/YeaQ/YmgE family stress response membrane protein [Caulifigura sp.]